MEEKWYIKAKTMYKPKNPNSFKSQNMDFSC